MPLEKAWAICRASRLLVRQCKQELIRLRKSHIEAEAFNEAARSFLQTAKWTPPRQFEEPPPALFCYLPVERSGDAGWCKRAGETRLFAEKATDANVRRELMAIAELYDLLGSAAVTQSPPAAGCAPPAVDAIAA